MLPAPGSSGQLPCFEYWQGGPTWPKTPPAIQLFARTSSNLPDPIMVSKKNGNAKGGRPKRKRRTGSGDGGDLARLRAGYEKPRAKPDGPKAKRKEEIAASEEKIKKIR